MRYLWYMYYHSLWLLRHRFGHVENSNALQNSWFGQFRKILYWGTKKALRPFWTRACRIVRSQTPLGDTSMIYSFLHVANFDWHRVLLSRVLRVPLFVFMSSCFHVFWSLELAAARKQNFGNKRLFLRLPFSMTWQISKSPTIIRSSVFFFDETPLIGLWNHVHEKCLGTKMQNILLY